MGVFRGLGPHLLRLGERQGVGGGQRRRASDSGERGSGASAALCLEIPQGAVDRVSRGAGLHRRLQVGAGHVLFDEGPHGLDGAQHRLDRFAVAGIGHALAPTR